ncbi:MAG: hypothetical protein ACFFD7_12920, partial [Candidatus Thorarchaeota archaeon]
MTSSKDQKDKKSFLPKEGLSRLEKTPRLIIYGFGLITHFWYFWCIIGLVIGILYYILLKDRTWRRNGILLATSISFITFFVFTFKTKLLFFTGFSIFHHL